MKHNVQKHDATRGELHRLAVVWVGALLLSFATVGGAQVWLLARLHRQAARVAFDGQSLRSSGDFESAILSRTSQTQARSLLKSMKSAADSPQEAALVTRIGSTYNRWQSVGETARPDALLRLLRAIQAHRDHNAAQLSDTQAQSQSLNRTVDLASLVVLGAASVLLLGGVLEGRRRLLRPVEEMSRAARRFGSGDLAARASVMRQDELGRMCETFNGMAGAIQDREHDRVRFVATVAHDLKNPLVVIGGAASLLSCKSDRLSPEQQAHWLAAIGRQVRQLEEMVADITTDVEAHTGALSLSRSRFDFAQAAREAVQDHTSSAHNHELIYEGAEDCVIEGDRRKLERVVWNLLSNAIKYSPRGGRVCVRVQVEPAAKCAVLRVSDEGEGIAAEDVPLLFQPFARLDRTRMVAQGTGLGLASVKKIVEAHGGTICLESTLGQGTMVEIALPLPSTST